MYFIFIITLQLAQAIFKGGLYLCFEYMKRYPIFSVEIIYYQIDQMHE